MYNKKLYFSIYRNTFLAEKVRFKKKLQFFYYEFLPKYKIFVNSDGRIRKEGAWSIFKKILFYLCFRAFIKMLYIFFFI